jgi:hypothetical protein
MIENVIASLTFWRSYLDYCFNDFPRRTFRPEPELRGRFLSGQFRIKG